MSLITLQEKVKYQFILIGKCRLKERQKHDMYHIIY